MLSQGTKNYEKEKKIKRTIKEHCRQVLENTLALAHIHTKSQSSMALIEEIVLSLTCQRQVPLEKAHGRNINDSPNPLAT